ncbi:MAG: HNH endonuclease [Rhodospirillaceae bacterium]|nr:HNH endonuclease [Rhodospirillaceae bacterium]
MDVSVEFLRECFDVDTSTGALVWKMRPISHFCSQKEANRWNSRYAGRPALRTVWSNGGLYGEVQYNGKRVHLEAARVVFSLIHGTLPRAWVDHIDGNRGNNSPSNLREATPADNAKNQRGWARKRGLKGAYWRGREGKFRALITADGKRFILGDFQNEEQAHAAYCMAATKLHGEFSNFGRGQ